MEKIVVIGDSCIDIFIDNIPKDKAEYSISYHISTGGNGNNFALSYSSFNKPLKFITAIGKDNLAELLKEDWKKKGIKDLKFGSCKKTALSIIFQKKGFYGILSNKECLDSIPNAGKVKLGYLAGPYHNEGIIEKIEAERLFIDLCYDRKEKWRTDFLRKAEIVFMNETEAKKTGFNDRNIIKVIKKGKNGAEVRFKGKVIKQKGVKVNTINETAAGDIFNAAFLVKYLEQEDLKKALEFANLVAAKSTEFYGNRFIFSDKFELLLRQEGYL